MYQTVIHDMPVLRVPALEAHATMLHAIFTRQGGVSAPPFSSLNLSSSVGDAPDALRQNFQRACRAVGITPAQTVSCTLVHGADVSVVDDTTRQQDMGTFDSLITATPGIYLTMRFADCTPLIFFDPVRQAIGLAHAGWRSTMQNVARATVTALTQQLGCRAADIIAVIGPAIGPCCYEVGAEVMVAAAETFRRPEHLLTQRARHDRAYFNLWEANRQQLADAGIEHVIMSNICTACHTDLFFSHRAERGKTGRFGVIMGLSCP